VALPDGSATSIEGDDEHNGANNDQGYWGPGNLDIFQMVVNLVDVGIRQGTSYQYSQTTQLQQRNTRMKGVWDITRCVADLSRIAIYGQDNGLQDSSLAFLSQHK
jgi:hypothetical protein